MSRKMPQPYCLLCNKPTGSWAPSNDFCSSLCQQIFDARKALKQMEALINSAASSEALKQAGIPEFTLKLDPFEAYLLNAGILNGPVLKDQIPNFQAVAARLFGKLIALNDEIRRVTDDLIKRSMPETFN